LAFVPFKMEVEPISEVLEKHNITVFGISTFGSSYEDPITQSSISILLLDLNPDYFKIIYKEHIAESPESTATSLAKEISAHFENPGILIYTSDFSINFTTILKRFTDEFGMDVNMFGAIAGNDVGIAEGFVFTNQRKSKKGIMALAFNSDKLEMKGDAFSGWKSVGTIKTVTKSSNTEIFEIDGKPAIDITMKYSGINELPEDWFEANILVSRTLSMNFLRENREPVTLMGLLNMENRSMITQANCPVGTKVQFALPPEFEVIDETINRFGQLQKETPDTDAVILYSCMNRLDVLGPFVKDEVKGIRKLWDAPLAGFMSNGEIGRAKGGELEIHNCTSICVTLKEK
jgi:hypothetical protein